MNLDLDLTDNEKYLVGGLLAGAVLLYIIQKNKSQKSATVIPSVAEVQGSRITVGQDGRRLTPVGPRFASEITYTDFNEMIKDKTGKLAGYQQNDLVFNANRAFNYLQQINWIDTYDKYQNKDGEKLSDIIMFAYNSGNDFGLVAPYVIANPETTQHTV